MSDREDAAEASLPWRINAYPQAPANAQGLAVLINLIVVGSIALKLWMRNRKLARQRTSQ